MRLPLILGVMLLAACTQGSPGAGNAASVDSASERPVTPTMPGAAITLTAADGVVIHGALYRAANPKAVILLFHQAGSGKGEYATIAPRLVAMGYTALAIDQRSGGDLFGRNETASAIATRPTYLDAKADLQAALDWARPQGKPIVLWGSSYSSALVFLVARENPRTLAGLLSFSPGEYLGQDDLVRSNAAKLAIPVFVTSAKNAGEIAAAKAIVDAVPGSDNVDAVPMIAGVHGSSTLIPARNPRGAEDNWRAVEAFLRKVAP